MSDVTTLGLRELLDRLRDILDELRDRLGDDVPLPPIPDPEPDPDPPAPDPTPDPVPMPDPVPPPPDPVPVPPDDDTEPDEPPIGNPGEWGRVDNPSSGYRYRLYRPVLAPGVAAPLIVFLHGRGKIGTNNTSQLNTQGPKTFGSREFQARHPSFVLAPQSTGGWNPQHVMDTIQRLRGLSFDHRLRALPIDWNRVYVTGQSMGGGGTLAFADAFPDVCAAIAPIATGSHGPTGTPNDSQINALARTISFIPFWGHNGEREKLGRVQSLNRLRDAINNLGGDARITIWPGVGHGSWNPAYQHQPFLDWMLSQSKSDAPIPGPDPPPPPPVPDPDPIPDPIPVPDPPPPPTGDFLGARGAGVFAHFVAGGGRKRRQQSQWQEFAANSELTGTQNSYMWSYLSTGPERYDFGQIHNDLDVWARHGKKVWLEIGSTSKFSNDATPQWVLNRCPHVVLDRASGAQQIGMCIPWTEVYLDLWRDFVSRIADEFDGHPAVEFVAMGGWGADHEPRGPFGPNRYTSVSWSRAIAVARQYGWDNDSESGVWFNQAYVPIVEHYAEVFSKTRIQALQSGHADMRTAVYELAEDLDFIVGTNGFNHKAASTSSRNQWRSRHESYSVDFGYMEWGPAGRGGMTLRQLYEGAIGSGADHSALCYLPSGTVNPSELDDIAWAANHLRNWKQ